MIPAEPTPRAVLRLIQERGTTARVNLAEVTGLSPATITTLTAELIRSGLIRETAGRKDGSRRGRPPVQLEVVPEAVFVAGAKVSPRGISVVLIDFAGQVRARHSVDVSLIAVAPERLVAEIAAAVGHAAARLGVRPAVLGVGLPGFLDAEAGLCHWSAVLAPGVHPIGPALSARLGCPVRIDNDANIATLAELWFGRGVGLRDFIVITVEHGVGMGLVLGGQLFRGARGIGAEFGHSKIRMRSGVRCQCGQTGCVEAFVADYALTGRAREAGIADDFGGLRAAAQAGDAAARGVFAEAGTALAVGLANLCNILDPPVIIFSGEQARFDLMWTPEAARTLAANVIRVSRPAPEIVLHQWEDRLWARGAAALALSAVMDGAAMPEPA